MITGKENDAQLVFNLAYYPDKHLLRRTELVTDFSNIPQIVETMFKTMVLHNGIGLAANQCKLTQRIFVIRTNNIRQVFVNPQTILTGDELIGDELCLSFPGIVAADIRRFSNALVSAQDQFGNDVNYSLEGIEAICAQHEMDHLNGKTFIDNRSRVKKMVIEHAVKKALKDPKCLSKPKRV